MQEKPFTKAYTYAYGITLKKRATRTLPDHQPAKNLILVFGFYGQKGDKS